MRRPARRLFGAIVTASLLAMFGGALAMSHSIQRHREGMVATLTVGDTDAAVDWRFFRPLPKPLTEVWATLNGRELGTPSYELFPAAGQSTAAIVLLDVGDPSRAAQIKSMKKDALVLALRKSERDLLGLAVYGLSVRLLAPDDDRPDAIAQLLFGIPPLLEKSNLSGALIHSIRTLERWPGDRRAIYVFTDGHNDGTIPLNRIGDLAAATDVALTFIVAQSARKSDAFTLGRLAAKTGGQFVDESQIKTFLSAPFALLHSGARVRFPLQGVVRFFWEGGSDVKVTLSDGTSPLELTAPAEVPRANVTETARYLLGSRPMVAVAFGVAVTGFGGGLAALAALTRRRRRDTNDARPKELSGERRPRVSVLLQNTGDGSAFPLQGAEIRVGRGSSNDIVLGDETVSRLHALLRSSGNGYAIENISDVNGTIVNGAPVDTAVLANGDLITLGKSTLRFVLVGPDAEPQ